MALPWSKGWMQCETGGGVGTSLSLAVHLADDASVFFVLSANERTKIRATHFCREAADGCEFRPYIGDLHGCGEPACEIRDGLPGSLPRHSFGFNHRGGAWPIFNHHCPALHWVDLIAEQSGRDISDTACWRRDSDLDWPSLRPCTGTQERRENDQWRAQTRAVARKFHGIHSVSDAHGVTLIRRNRIGGKLQCRNEV